MELEEVKLWLKVDYDFEDDLIQSIIQSAEEELTFSGVPKYKKGDEGYALYTLAIKYIIARDYESRGYSNDNSKSKTFNERALQRMILKLKAW